MPSAAGAAPFGNIAASGEASSSEQRFSSDSSRDSSRQAGQSKRPVSVLCRQLSQSIRSQASQVVLQPLQTYRSHREQPTEHSLQRGSSQRSHVPYPSPGITYPQSLQATPFQRLNSTYALPGLYVPRIWRTSVKKSSNRPSARARRIGAAPSPSQSRLSRTCG